MRSASRREAVCEWHRMFATEPELCGEDASLEELTADNKRLRKQLQPADIEREIIAIATAYFAKESK